MADFKDRFRELRQEKGLSQKEVGQHLGYSESTISLYESGEREPKKLQDLLKIADYFNVSTDYLLGRFNNKNGFISEHNISGHNVRIGADKKDFSNGLSEEDAVEYLEVANAIRTLGLSNEDLNLLLALKEAGVTFQDVDEFKNFKDANMNKSDIDLLKTIKAHLKKNE